MFNGAADSLATAIISTLPFLNDRRSEETWGIEGQQSYTNMCSAPANYKQWTEKFLKYQQLSSVNFVLKL